MDQHFMTSTKQMVVAEPVEVSMESSMVQLGNLGWMARILLWFCRAPGTPDYPMTGVHYESGTELKRLEEVFPDFTQIIQGKDVIDFGCGEGYQAVAFARAGAARVIGIEIHEPLIEAGCQRIAGLGLEKTIQIERQIPAGLKADVIVSQNSFEHFLDAGKLLAEMRSALAPSGRLFITFAPPWYAPWGAHMAFFCRLPWVQLLFPERSLMEVRSLFRSDGARSYRDAGLAQMSISKFERIVAAAGLRFLFKRYDCVREMNWLQRTPLRELFINRVSCVLSEPA